MARKPEKGRNDASEGDIGADAKPGLVRCSCDPERRLERVRPEDLVPFQRDLKSLTSKAYAGLRASLDADGILMPMAVWDAPDGHRYILDGHQRHRVILHDHLEVEGGGIPVVTVAADTAREAATKLLKMVSQYGKVDRQGLYEYASHYDLELPSMTDLALPEVDWEAFQTEFYGAAGDNMPDLPDDIDQPEFVQMRFTLHRSQKETVDAAIDAARDASDDVDCDNKNSNGNALAAVCAHYMVTHANR